MQTRMSRPTSTALKPALKDLVMPIHSTFENIMAAFDDAAGVAMEQEMPMRINIITAMGLT